MLTLQSLKLLFILRKMTTPTIVNYHKGPNQYEITESSNFKQDAWGQFMIKNQNNVKTICKDEFDYLIETGYIKKSGPIEFTHKGYHPLQFSMIKFLNFCYRSILIPILVTFIINWLGLV